MAHTFYPAHYAQSAYEIPYEQLYGEGKRALIFDIDNTLVPHGAPADRRAAELMARLKKIGFSICVLSNNKEPRVKSFADAVGVLYIFKAGKPKKAGYLRAMEQMGSTAGTTMFVGDQIFTDIWGANRVGLETYLTAPIHPKEEIQIVLKRYLEKPVLYFYFRKLKREKRN